MPAQACTHECDYVYIDRTYRRDSTLRSMTQPPNWVMAHTHAPTDDTWSNNQHNNVCGTKCIRARPCKLARVLYKHHHFWCIYGGGGGGGGGDGDLCAHHRDTTADAAAPSSCLTEEAAAQRWWHQWQQQNKSINSLTGICTTTFEEDCRTLLLWAVDYMIHSLAAGAWDTLFFVFMSTVQLSLMSTCTEYIIATTIIIILQHSWSRTATLLLQHR